MKSSVKMNRLFEQIKKEIENIKNSSDDRYLIVTDQFLEENKDKILELGLVESDIKIFKIGDSVNMTELVKNYDQKYTDKL